MSDSGFGKSQGGEWSRYKKYRQHGDVNCCQECITSNWLW